MVQGAATVVNDAALAFAASTVGGALSATATTGHITDSGALAITGASTFITAATGSNIVLDHASNAFTGAVTLKADTGGDEAFGNIAFVDSAAVKLDSDAGSAGDLFIDASTDGAVGGTLSVTATTGNITQGVALAVTGTTTLVTDADDATITLGTSTNAFTGALTITTNDASGTDADVTIDAGTTALVIAASTVDGDLTLRSGHASGITDSGTVTVGGNLAVTTDAGNGVVNMGTLSSRWHYCINDPWYRCCHSS